MVDRLPVVLVHGWRGPDSDRLEDSEFWHLATWLRDDGFEPFYATGISPENTLHENARRLQQVIAQAKEATGAPSVIVIAFSMGGLNTRAYLESTLYEGDVAQAIILGTPHRGEWLWLPLLLWEQIAWTDEPSATELLPDHAALFNSTHSNAAAVPYTLIAGDADSDSLPTLFRDLAPGDGLVSTWSALGADGMVADRAVTDDIHAWSRDTMLLDVPSLLFPRSTYDAYIRPRLFGVAPGSLNSPAAEAYEPLVSAPRSGLRTGSLAPGAEIVLDPMPLERLSRARVYVRWKGPAPTVSLRDPRGRIINEDSAAKRDDVEYLALDFADLCGYVLTDTVAGPWQVVLTSPERADEPTEYVAYASFESDLTIAVQADSPVHEPGASAELTVSLRGAETATIEQVRIDVYAPDGQHHELTETRETDDTARADIALDAGSGYYRLLVTAGGTVDGRPFERGAEHVLVVSADWARLNGHYALSVVEDTNAGSRVALVSVGVSADSAGSCLLSVTVSDLDTDRSTTIAHPLDLPAGNNTVAVRVPLTALNTDAAQHSLVLSRAQLLDVQGAAIPLDTDAGHLASIDRQ